MSGDPDALACLHSIIGPENTPSFALSGSASSSFSLLGYLLALSGSDTLMDRALYKKKTSMKPSDDDDRDCQFHSPVLTLLISSVYLAALVSSLVSSRITRVSGRRVTMFFGGNERCKCWFGYSRHICIYVAGFSYSWSPLGWLVPSEIFPLEVRSVGQSISVSVRMFVVFGFAQVLNPMLCHFKLRLFIAFACCTVSITILVYVYLPETKRVPIEEMGIVWREHPRWKTHVEERNYGTY